MSELNDSMLGEAIQNHVRRKWRLREHWQIEDAKEIVLEDRLVARIYLLGVDDKQLLDVEPMRVRSRLEELEAEAILEDGGLRRR